jgi:hypothetical protein
MAEAIDKEGIEAVLRRAAAKVCQPSLDGRGWVITTAILLPSGSLATLSVEPLDRERVLVTDNASAWREADMAMTPPDLFRRAGQRVARRDGLRFEADMLSLDCAPDRLPAAIPVVATATLDLARAAADAWARSEDSFIAPLIKRLKQAYRGKVFEHRKIHGASSAEYEVDAWVESRNGPVILKGFTPHGASINALYAEMSDISRLENPPARLGITPDTAAVGPKLELVASVCNVASPEIRAEDIEGLAA